MLEGWYEFEFELNVQGLVKYRDFHREERKGNQK
jgi:hypothetical protein